jgi:SNF2 family DNA or RNA helicase
VALDGQERRPRHRSPRRGLLEVKVLHPYQVEAANWANGRNMLFADECGLGKTFEAIEVVKRRRAQGNVGPVLVLCRKQARPQWKEMIEEQDPGAMTFVCNTAGRWPEGEVQLRHLFHPRHDAWVISHHEALSLKTKEALHEWSKYAWDLIIVDEAHRFKSRTSVRMRQLKQIDSLQRMGLSGSPIEKNPADLWALLNWFYPEHFTAYWEFFNEWVEWVHPYGTPPQVKVAKGVKPERAKAFAKLIAPYVLRRTKAQVAPELPPKIESRVPLEMEKAQKEAYDAVRRTKDIETIVPGRLSPLLIKNALSKIVRLQQIASDPKMLGIDAPSVKVQWVLDYLEDNPEEIAVVFTRFRAVARRLANDCGADLLMGGVQGGGAAFLSGEARVLCGTIQAMGSSLNLQRARTAIFVDCMWSTIEMTQAVDRIHRIDITEPKNVIYLRCVNTVDDLVLKALDHKWSEQQLVWHFLQGEQHERR